MRLLLTLIVVELLCLAPELAGGLTARHTIARLYAPVIAALQATQ